MAPPAAASSCWARFQIALTIAPSCWVRARSRWLSARPRGPAVAAGSLSAAGAEQTWRLRARHPPSTPSSPLRRRCRRHRRLGGATRGCWRSACSASARPPLVHAGGAVQVLRVTVVGAGSLLIRARRGACATSARHAHRLSSVAGERVRPANVVMRRRRPGSTRSRSGSETRCMATACACCRPPRLRPHADDARPLAAPFAIAPEDVAARRRRGLDRGAVVVWSPPALRWVMLAIAAPAAADLRARRRGASARRPAAVLAGEAPVTGRSAVRARDGANCDADARRRSTSSSGWSRAASGCSSRPGSRWPPSSPRFVLLVAGATLLAGASCARRGTGRRRSRFIRERCARGTFLERHLFATTAMKSRVYGRQQRAAMPTCPGTTGTASGPLGWCV